MAKGIVGLWIGLTAGTLFTAVLTLRHVLERKGAGSHSSVSPDDASERVWSVRTGLFRHLIVA
jgi:hypothetical protein